MTLLLVYFFIALSASFLCSLLESVFLSINYSFVESAIEKEARYAKALKKMKSEVSYPLSAILAVNTIANTLGAAGVGAQAHKLYGSAFVTFCSIILTLLILFFCEILPKTLGASYWKAFVPFTVYSTRFLMIICWPFLQVSHLIQRLFRNRIRQHSITREDLLSSTKIAAKQGYIYNNEKDFIKNILKLKKKKVSEVMTPRTVITAFEESMTIDAVLQKYQPLRYARVPVFKETLDQVLGVTRRYKLLEAHSRGEGEKTVGAYLDPLHSIPESMSISAALHQFITRKDHIFLVVDEYGSVSGLISLEDVVETILGIEIVDELDSVADLREQALRQWKKKKKEKKSS